MKQFIKYSMMMIAIVVLTVSCDSHPSLQKYYVDSKENVDFISIDIPASILKLKNEDVSDEVNTLKTTTFYIWSDIGKIKYIDNSGEIIFIEGNEFDSFEIEYTGTPTLVGDIRTEPKLVILDTTSRCTDINALNYGEIGACVFAPRKRRSADRNFIKTYRTRR